MSGEVPNPPQESICRPPKPMTLVGVEQTSPISITETFHDVSHPYHQFLLRQRAAMFVLRRGLNEEELGVLSELDFENSDTSGITSQHPDLHYRRDLMLTGPNLFHESFGELAVRSATIVSVPDRKFAHVHLLDIQGLQTTDEQSLPDNTPSS